MSNQIKGSAKKKLILCPVNLMFIWATGLAQRNVDLSRQYGDLRVLASAAKYELGSSLGGGDINGDGVPDMIIGAPGKFGTGHRGEVYMIYGSPRFRPEKEINLGTTNADITIKGEQAGDHLGAAVCFGDVNADGFDDMIIGASKADAPGGIDAGKTYLFFGTAAFPQHHVIDVATTPADLTVGGDIPGSYLGNALASADFDDNGLDDLVMGADGANPSGNNTGGGKTVLLYGFCNVSIPTNMAYINGVPVSDVNQPPATTLPSTIPDNFCAPMAAVNILAYWHTAMVHSNAAGVTGLLPLDETTEFIGYFMDTNDSGSRDRGNGRTLPTKPGTYTIDQIAGLGEFILWDKNHLFATPPPNLPPNKTGYDWLLAPDSLFGFSFFKSEIDSGKPAKLDFFFWNPVRTGASIVAPVSGNTIDVYYWGTSSSSSFNSNEVAPPEDWNFEEGSGGIGHAVTGVGYIENWNPGCSILPTGNYAIVHDNWATTAKNVAIPWVAWNMTIAVDPTPPPQVVCRYIPNVPDENQPPQSGRNNWCVLTAAVNIIDY